jgi:AraC-like DNA-binding protein
MDLYTRIVKAKVFMDTHYQYPLNLEKLSEEACFSKFHFLRLFKKTYNKTPHQYLIERRLDVAKEKLKQDDLRISDICVEIGFESPTSFSLKFKKQVGQTPALFRLRAMQKLKLSQEKPDHVIPHCFLSKFC